MTTGVRLMVVGLAALFAGCSGADGDDAGGDDADGDPTLSVADGQLWPEPDDETFDPADPPTTPDPMDVSESQSALVVSGKLDASKCPKRSTTLSPKGVTFVIHVSKHYGGAAFKQLEEVSHLVRARDIFMIERSDEVLKKLRAKFPCNDIHYIAYPDEVDNALGLGKEVDGISIDWERHTFQKSQAWSIDQLQKFSAKTRQAGLRPSVVPYWPDSFNDGRITRVAKLDYELAQIQNRCVVGAGAFAAAAKGLLQNFESEGLSARDVGFEISLNSFDFADNHTGVDRSAACTRKAYGKGARAFYLYGNGHPHLADYFKAMKKLGLRQAK